MLQEVPGSGVRTAGNLELGGHQGNQRSVRAWAGQGMSLRGPAVPGCGPPGFFRPSASLATSRLLPEYSRIYPILPFPEASLWNPYSPMENAARALGCPPGLEP